jgi:hypothetical protein
MAEAKRLRSPVSGSTRLAPPRRGDIHRARDGEGLAGLMVAVAHDEAVAVLVALVDERGDVGVDLGAQRFGQHPSGAFANNLVDQ